MKKLLITSSLVFSILLTACGSKTPEPNTPPSRPAPQTASKTAETTVTEKVTEVDPFDGLDVSFGGTAPEAYVSTFYVGKNDTVNKYVTFSVDEDAVIKRGNKVTIKAEYKPDTPESEKITLLQTEKEYDVSGINEYVSSEFDATELDSTLDNAFSDIIRQSRTTGNSVFGQYLFLNDSNNFIMNHEYMIKDYHITPVKTCLEYIDEPHSDEFHNRYFRFYEVTFSVEKTKDNDPSDGRIIGNQYESDKLTYYLYVDDVMLTSDNQLHYDGEIIYNMALYGFSKPDEYQEIENRLANDWNYNYSDLYTNFWEEAKKQDANKHPSIQVVFENDIQ